MGVGGRCPVAAWVLLALVGCVTSRSDSPASSSPVAAATTPRVLVATNRSERPVWVDRDQEASLGLGGVSGARVQPQGDQKSGAKSLFSFRKDRIVDLELGIRQAEKEATLALGRSLWNELAATGLGESPGAIPLIAQVVGHVQDTVMVADIYFETWESNLPTESTFSSVWILLELPDKTLATLKHDVLTWLAANGPKDEVLARVRQWREGSPVLSH